MKKVAISFDIFIVILSVFAIFTIKGYPMEATLGPGPGVFPMAVSVCLLLSSIGDLIQTVIMQKKDNKENNDPFFTGEGKKNLFVFLGFLALYVVLIYLVGLVLASVVFMICVCRFFEKHSWKQTLLSTALSVLVMYLVFCLWLEADVPMGLLF